jgi:hypothetical protein
MNELEKAILNEIAKTHSDLKESLSKHFSVLRIKNREFTGVGIYVNFEYDNSDLPLIPKNHLTGNAELKIPNLEFPVNYEIAITNGLISFMELVANGSEWNGKYDGFNLN